MTIFIPEWALTVLWWASHIVLWVMAGIGLLALLMGAFRGPRW